MPTTGSMISRRAFFATSLAALAAARCATSVPPLAGIPMLPAGTVRLRSRPSSAGVGAATAQPLPLGLGGARDGAYYVPSGAASVRPLIVVLHGAGGSGARFIRRFIDQADRTGAILLAPDSRGRTWDLMEQRSGTDAPFIDGALDFVFRTCAADSRRICIAGFSDGASYALSLGLTNGDLFSAVAAFSPGVLAVGADYRGTPRVLITHGRQDDILPFARCGEQFARQLKDSGYRVDFRPFDGKHTLPAPEVVSAAFDDLVS